MRKEFDSPDDMRAVLSRSPRPLLGAVDWGAWEGTAGGTPLGGRMGS